MQIRRHYQVLGGWGARGRHLEILSQSTDGSISKVSVDLKYLKSKGKLRRETEKIHCYQCGYNLDLNGSKYTDTVFHKVGASKQTNKKKDNVI